MNFISMIKQGEVALELKYCERCGGLWVRPQGNEGVYCEGCCARMAALALPLGRRTNERRLRRVKNIESQVQIGCLLGLAETEVRL